MVNMALLGLFIELLTFFILPVIAEKDHQIVLSHTDYHTFKCQHFASTLSIPNVTVNFAHWLPAGTLIELEQGYGVASCGWTHQTVIKDICRIAMNVINSPRSNLTFEAWLPNQEEWTDRFLSTANGGNSGCIRYPDLAYTSGLGFAAVGEQIPPATFMMELT